MWMVRVGTTDRTGATNIAFSTDSGANWFQGSAPGGADARHGGDERQQQPRRVVH